MILSAIFLILLCRWACPCILQGRCVPGSHALGTLYFSLRENPLHTSCKLKYKFLFLSLLLSSLAWNNLNAQKWNLNSHFQKAIQKFAEDTVLFNASVSVTVLENSTGTIVGSYDSYRTLIPASSSKLFSVGAMLKQAGPSFRYRTPFVLIGQTNEDRIFQGHLIVKPSSDPSFCSPHQPGAMSFSQLVDTLEKRLDELGIKKIQGQILVEDEFIQDVPENPEWLYYDLGNYYGSGCYSLNFLENTCWISLQEQTRSGRVCDIISVYPPMLKDQFCSEVISTAEPTQEDIYVLGSNLANYSKVMGSIQCCGSDTLNLKAAMSNPPSVFAEMLIAELKSRSKFERMPGVKFKKQEQTLFTYQSVPLIDLSERALKKSVNLYCESFLHQFGFLRSENTSRSTALKDLEYFWSKEGIDTRGLRLEDGSGLSPKTKCSSFQLAQVLQNFTKSKLKDDFVRCLPNVSEEGPLAGSLSSCKKCKNRYRLKSGSMESVRSFSGYIMDGNKPKYSISLIVNHYDCSSDKIRKLIAQLLINML